MADLGSEPRPDIETFECMGCRVELVDAADILAAAAVEPVELLRDAAFPAPVRQVRCTVSATPADGPVEPQGVHVLAAEISTGTGERARPLAGGAILGNDPIGALLARRLAAGDPWVGRIVDGVETATAELYRRLGRRPPATAGADREPAAAAVREADVAGSPATVRFAETPAAPGTPGGGCLTVTIRAAVASDVVSAAHLRALFCLVLEVVGELSGDAEEAPPLAGRGYVLRRYPAARTPEPDGPGGVTLDHVGGLADVVAQFRQVAVSFGHPQAMARWGARRPQGILLYGPPGTGKTMLARALANEIGASLREIRTPEILDKWLGASERNIKRIFREARRYRTPTVLLFDEFDSIISYAGGGSDAASQAVNAVAGIFKQEMNDLIEDNPNVIVVATTNFPDRVDQSLIRSGRFDIKIAIPRPDEAGLAEIMAKMIRQLIAKHETPGFQMFADDIDPRAVARHCHGMTGADIREALRRVQLAKAMQEARTGAAAPISQGDLERCIAELRHARPAA